MPEKKVFMPDILNDIALEQMARDFLSHHDTQCLDDEDDVNVVASELGKWLKVIIDSVARQTAVQVKKIMETAANQPKKDGQL